MKYTDGLFFRVGREIAKEYEGVIEYNEALVDALCMQLVQRPENFDVLVMPNLYGDIVSDVCAGLVGGLGVAPGANIGTEAALFELAFVYLPVEGSELADEKETLTIGMYGESYDFFVIKGVMEQLLAAMGIKEYEFRPCSDDPTFHPGRTARLM